MHALSLALVAFGLACSAAATPRWHELDGYTFKQYVQDFQKSYSDNAEFVQRSAIFAAKLASVKEHNAQKPAPSWRKGINHLSDRTERELSELRGLNKKLLYSYKKEAQANAIPFDDSILSLPRVAAVDWRTKPGVLTAVKNQGECGSCWTFASVETLESQWFLKTGYTQDLSEQFVLDCTPNPQQCGGTGGCDGGTAELAYARIKAVNGIPSEYTYPYISGLGENSTCKATFPLQPQQPHHGGIMAAAMVSGYTNVPSNDFDAVTAAVTNVGPLAISVDAGAWHDYESGIFAGGNKTNPDLDHLVQLVGFGSDSDGTYWIVRNSWTPQWGEKGFIRLSTTAECGTDITPLDGNGCKGGPSSIKVCGQNGMLFDAIYPVVKPF